MCFKYLEYNFVDNVITEPRLVDFDRRCNGFVVKNTGTTLVRIMGENLSPGESKSIGGNYGEIYVGRLKIDFVTQTPAPAVITNSATVSQKVYVKSRDLI